ncbi:hypothetical protein [Halocalculus aciditolerans]|uniref:Uncharacterized protein n=1 Tax=Halocalculus aciditolerans TaxID=1383812 RepID=A0A830FH65_9EURY|nr:hypothetical protein [Halocalculus aciditolerans]GGL55579.1 hypothetical protein GCM10009039_12170 [Halocalculus aciditolerans]
MRKLAYTLVLSFLVVSTFATTPVVADDPDFTGPFGLEYTVTFDKPSLTVTTKFHNPTNKKLDGSVMVLVDDWAEYTAGPTVSPGETVVREFNVSNGLKGLPENHTIYVGAWGQNETFEFTRDVNLTNPRQVAVPWILDVEVATREARGEMATVLLVTVRNPSDAPWDTALFAHTLETDGSGEGAMVPPNSTTVTKMELFEPLGSRVAGEVRLYSQPVGEPRHPLDQVGFVGSAESETEAWNQSYEEITAPWKDDGYSYENASLDPSKGPYGIPSPTYYPLQYGAGLLAVLVVLGGWRRLR